MAEKRLKSVPEKIQLPHNIQIKRLPFKIVAYNPDGSPKTFELLPTGTTGSDCFLFADEDWIRSPIPGKAGE